MRDPSELWFPVRAKPGEEGLDDRMVGGRRISGRLLADEEVVALADGLPDGFDARAKLLEIAEELLESAKGRPRSRGLKQVLRSRLGNSPDLPVEIPAELVELIPDIAERWSRRMAAAREKHGTKSARRTAQLEQLDHLLDVAKTRGVEQARRLLSVAIRSSWLGLDIKWLDGHETGGGGGSRPAPGGGGRFGREDDEEGWL